MGWSTRRVVTLVVAAAGAVLATMPAASAASRDHGASFAVICDFSHRSSDDPIVHHGEPGASHSHDFFGNRSTDAYSTHASLQAAPEGTTCTRPKDTAAYWIPTVRWNGEELTSNHAVFYYRAGGKDHTKVKPFPAGLKVIASNTEHIKWRCGRTDKGGGSRKPPTRCDNGELGVRIVFPDCSNGHLDSANHRSHMAYSRRRDGRVRCPRSHPRSVPVLTMNVTFPIPTTPGRVTVACDEASPCGASSMHADFFNAWDQTALNSLVRRCINNVPPSKLRPKECQAPRV